jgi:uncharacterized iron-regulated membrane protein
MRLTRRALLIFWSYHAWAGASIGLVVYVMVLSGTITLFRQPLELWGEPIRQQQVVATPRRLQVDLDLALAAIGAPADELWMSFAAADRGATTVGYERAEDEPWQRLIIDQRQGRALPEREALATFLYHLHFLWHPGTPWLYYVAGIAAVGLLLAIVTGVFIHLRGFVREFHQFRPHQPIRTVWSDLHKVLGVVGLPFQVFYAYSGALLVLGPPLIATLTSPVLGVDPRTARQWSGGSAEAADPRGAPCAVRPLDELYAIAARSHPGVLLRSAILHHHGTTSGWVEFEGRGASAAAEDVTVRVREHDGEVLARTERAAVAARKFDAWIRRLHFAELGGTSLRALYAILGLASALTILSGNWIWIARRRQAGSQWLARLTVGIGAGIMVAIATLFVASRLLPLDAGRRTSSEELVFGGALFACIAWSLSTRRVQALWWKMCALAGALLAAVPLLATRVTSAGLLGRVGSRVPAVVGVDTALLVVGLLLLWVAHVLHRHLILRPVGANAESGERDAVVAAFRHPARGGSRDA